MRTLFCKQRIKKKKIRVRPQGKISEKLAAQHVAKRVLMCQETKAYVEAGRDAVFADESCFTWRGYSETAWARKGDCISGVILPAQRRENCISVCGAISRERGQVH